MERYNEVLRKKILMCVLLIAITIPVIITLTMINAKIPSNHSTDFIKGVQFGMFFGLETLLLMNIIKFRGALNNKEKLKLLYIKENDEREKLILLKSSLMAINIITVILALGIIVSGFYNEIVFFTLIMTLFIVGVVRIGLKIYYNKKY
ncbi:hypothetical protein [Clostridium senegalense]|uniref:Uncharacterized protein n=1 Tax=Clostridium senegalense TaxID=1465809 RepID=A0A6M0H7E6_9CLOT|nr:hypothetical protein [Clostridium senegalense]NEU06288.1 hypothetical protein [Clostridium senegalense]